jgi:hypothetical protein
MNIDQPHADPFQRAHLLRCYRSALRNLRTDDYHEARVNNLRSAEQCRRKLLGLRLSPADYDYGPVEVMGDFRRIG